MAEAALHLLPHLFMPHDAHDDHGHHGSDHGHGHGHDHHANTYSLIALGFLATFAVDRYVGRSVVHTRASAAAAAAVVASVSLKEGVASADGGTIADDHRGRHSSSDGSTATNTEGDLSSTETPETEVTSATASASTADPSTQRENQPPADEATAVVEAQEQQAPVATVRTGSSAAADTVSAGAVADEALPSVPPRANTSPDIDEAAVATPVKSSPETTTKTEPATGETEGEETNSQPELTLYGNPKTPVVEQEEPAAASSPVPAGEDGGAADSEGELKVFRLCRVY